METALEVAGDVLVVEGPAVDVVGITTGVVFSDDVGVAVVVVVGGRFAEDLLVPTGAVFPVVEAALEIPDDVMVVETPAGKVGIPTGVVVLVLESALQEADGEVVECSSNVVVIITSGVVFSGVTIS